MTGIKMLSVNWQKPVSISPLITFRICFGLMMFLSLLRFWWRGWIDTVYLQPDFHFTYWGFEWVRPLPDVWMHIFFICLIISALFIALGFYYRVAIVFFFIGFTYVELLDVTTYLNHYYFISLVAFIMIWLPCSNDYSIDSWRNPQMKKMKTPAWNIGILRFQIGVVYFFAGFAKLNSDWLLLAEPMRTWLPAKSHLPYIGSLMYEEWVAYFFSWFGAIYDLFIVFFMLNRKTRLFAYTVVLIFHIATAIFFPAIGMFPYVMIMSSLIFFSGNQHEKILALLPFYKSQKLTQPGIGIFYFLYPRLIKIVLCLYILIQILVPLRFLLYPGNLFWNEEGYRFSWRVMLMEKAGVGYFTVKDKTGKAFYIVDNKEYLTPLQEKMMSTQPDLILKYAHYLAKKYADKGINDPKVYAEVFVTMNGRPSALFVDSAVNLAGEKLSWKHYKWVQEFNK